MWVDSNFPVLLVVLAFPWPSLSEGIKDHEGSSKQSKTQADLVNQVQRWIEYIRQNPLPTHCHGNDSGPPLTDELFIKNVPCTEARSKKRYAFDGQIVDGALHGVGTLQFKNALKDQENCLVVQNTFDLPPPDVISGDFRQGALSGVANFTWTDLGLKGSFHVRSGMLHGMLKIETTDGAKVMIAKAERNQLEKGCWIVNQKQVYMADLCSGVFKFDASHDNKLLIFSHDWSLITSGQFKSNAELIAQDVELEKVSIGEYVQQCDKQVTFKQVGPKFTYDLETETRSYEYSAHADLCNGTSQVEGIAKVQKFITDYIGRLEPALPLDPSPIDYDNSIQLLSSIELANEDSNVYEANLNLFSSQEVMFTYVGSLDAQKRFHGFALLKFLPNEFCFRGSCQVSDLGVLKGTFDHGLLQGLVSFTSKDDHLITYMAVKDGIVHGMVITYGITPLYKIPDRSSLGEGSTKFKFEDWKQSGLGKLAKFLNGRRLKDQPALLGLLGHPQGTQGYLYGILGPKGGISGDDQAYIYPNAALALVGTFKNNYMISGQKADIVKATCADNILKLYFSTPEGPTFKYNPPSNESLGDSPLTSDPYEASTVAVQDSSIPHSGQGLFAIRNVQPGEVLAFYNGFHYAGEEILVHEELCQHQTDGESLLEKLRKCQKYMINTHTGEMLNIPPAWDDLDKYNATLAHKVNNKFEPFTNAGFGFMEHPRFGNIIMVYAKKALQAGEEVFVNYDYSARYSLSNLSPWYLEQYKMTQEYLKMQSLGQDVSHLPMPAAI